MNNPIDGIVPDFTIFGAEFTELWQKIFAGLWGLAVVITIVFLVLGITKMAQGSSNPQGYKGAARRRCGLVSRSALVAWVNEKLSRISCVSTSKSSLEPGENGLAIASS